MIKLGHIELFVRDVQVSKAFYRDLLGFSVTVEQAPGLGDVRLATPRPAHLHERGPGDGCQRRLVVSSLPNSLSVELCVTNLQKYLAGATM